MVSERTSESTIDIGILLGLAYTRLVNDLNAHMRKQGFDDLGRWFGYVFRALGHEALTLTDLASRLEMTTAGAMKIIDEMDARGYVERGPDPNDARVKRLRLAPRGRRALATARRFHASFERSLGATDAKKLRAVLTAVAQVEPQGAPPVLRPM